MKQKKKNEKEKKNSPEQSPLKDLPTSAMTKNPIFMA